MRKLDEIIREYYIVELGMQQLDNRYPRFLLAGINALKDLNQDLKSIVTEVTLDVNDNDTVDLPSNYIDYLLIGLVSGGNIVTFGSNPNASPVTKDDCGDLVAPTSVSSVGTSVEGNFSTSNYSKDGQFVGGNYGIGGGGNINGTYKIYKQENYISLTGYTGDSIVLKYLATLEQVDGNFMVEEYLVEAVKAYMAWVTKKGMRSYGLGDKREALDEYKRQRTLALKRVGRFSIAEFMSAVRTGYRSSPGI